MGTPSENLTDFCFLKSDFDATNFTCRESVCITPNKNCPNNYAYNNCISLKIQPTYVYKINIM